MKMASVSQNVNAILQLMAFNNLRTPKDTAFAALGVFSYYYYCFCHEYHYPPSDLIDLVDGILFCEVLQYTQEYYHKQRKVNQSTQRKK